ncbi:MAG: chromosome segregation protein SMC [Acidimicrobiia bacterium]
MFLKTLTLKGFKSFADPTSLDLEPGVTVVVGPNGSGKSNVVDAIAWVLGAQAPSAVRSQKMDDVIFAGTAKRPALGRAEVSLTLDNTAGLIPIEFNEVTVTRTLFRTGDSEYAINGVPCRLLDVQELLSDAGVGRQQHVIVSQGQIDAVLNSRAEERRAIIEEAAGVLKYRKRKERSERRLEATEANLLRLQDLLREVRRQLRPLEKQADAARRHGQVVADLNALRLFLSGRELAALQTRVQQGAAERQRLNIRENELKSELARFDTEVMATEAKLSAQGGSDIADALRRCESLRERARGLAAVLAERVRSTERDRQALLGADLVAALEADAANITAQLADVESAALDLGPAADEVAQAEAALEALRSEVEQVDAPADSNTISAANAAAETRGELVALRQSLARAEQEANRLAQRTRSITERRDALAADVERLRLECESLQSGESSLVTAADAARALRQEAEEADAVNEAALREAQSELRGAKARVDALSMALDEARAKAGAQRLAAVDGMMGTLLDLVTIDAGWETAFEAAAGEALSAVVFSSAHTARQGLSALAAASHSGAVLAPSGGLRSERPVVGDPVRDHVRGSSSDVDSLLDTLIGNAVRVSGGWSEALDMALTHPEAIVVTDTGDRFAAGGWRIGTAGSGATATALDEARGALSAVESRIERLSEARKATSSQLTAAFAAERAAIAALDGNDNRFTAASAAMARVQVDLQTARGEIESLASQLATMSERRAGEQERLAELEAMLPDLEAAEHQLSSRAAAQRAARARLAERASAVSALRRDLEVRAAGLEERRQMLQRRLVDTEERLRRDAVQRAEAEQRRVLLDRALVALSRLQELVARHLETVQRHWEVLDAERQRQSEAVRQVAEQLDGVRRARAISEKELETIRDQSRRTEIDEAEVRLRLEQLIETVRRELDCEPAVAIAAQCPPLPEGMNPAARARELERELKLMGPINPLALEEFTALQERHAFLEEQLKDVQDTRRELTKVIKAVDAEIQSVFAAAYADVAANFTTLFSGLFPGGNGKLILTNPDDLLNTGIEVEAKPSGKNVKKLSLLSGGERSLTALAFLFAVFRSRPSPFYVMDEVEAALDDVNLHRFLGLIQEFRNEAQLIVVSHQKRTMEAADCLFGVTMQPGGSSKVISEKVGVG